MTCFGLVAPQSPVLNNLRMTLNCHLSFPRMACCTFHSVIKLVLCFHCLTEGPLAAEKNILCILHGVLSCTHCPFTLYWVPLNTPGQNCGALLYMKDSSLSYFIVNLLCASGLLGLIQIFSMLYLLSNDPDSDAHVQCTVTKRHSTVVPLSRNTLLKREFNPPHSCGPDMSLSSEFARMLTDCVGIGCDRLLHGT